MATILPLGAALTAVRLDGLPRNLVLEVSDPQSRAATPDYAGALVGPVANRVRAGRVVIGDETFQMPLNENGVTCLHSGSEGLHAQVWQVRMRGPDKVTLQCRLADGAIGLPGNREITATYTVEGTTLSLHITATTDRPTPMNIAAHPYWNLDGRLDVTGHQLTLAADRYLPIDAATLPTGEIAPVSGTPFDFTTARPVPRDPRLDVNYCLDEDTGPRLAATLKGADGTTLHLSTTAPGLQVYGGAHLPRADAALPDNPVLGPYAGIALEPQLWPDALFHRHFPAILLSPGHVWEQRTLYRLTAP